jgi:hypothetical protein
MDMVRSPTLPCRLDDWYFAHLYNPADAAAFAGGFILALACDFRLMTSGRGLMCMNEVSTTPSFLDSFHSPLTLFCPLATHNPITHTLITAHNEY